jgi:ABC-type transport system involved in cytochrome c biogenesis ATPase subunit
MLSKIIIYKLFNEFDYEIGLKGKLTYIHSQNGIGKSTVMRMVSNVLNGNLEEVRTVPFERMDLMFDTGTNIIVENINQELNVLAQRSEVEESISLADLRNVMKCLYIGPDRAYADDGEGHIIPSLMIYMRELSENIQKAISDSELKPAKDDGRPISDAELDTMFRDLEAKIDFIKGAGFGPTIPAGYRFPPSRYEISQYRDDYRKLALSLQQYVDTYYGFAESLIVYRDIVNTIYVNKSVTVNEKGFFEARMDNSGTIVPLAKFSSGEKQILIMFYLLLFNADPGSLVIIDEPEVSLHVSWQQVLGKTFADITRVRSLQMIVATHAPSVIHDDWDLAVELKANE